MADPDLQIREGGRGEGQSSRPRDKGGGGGPFSAHQAIRSKNKGWPRPSPGSATGLPTQTESFLAFRIYSSLRISNSLEYGSS